MPKRLGRTLLTAALVTAMSSSLAQAGDGGGAFDQRGITCQHERWLREVQRDRSPDVVIVGSSMALRGLHAPVIERRMTDTHVHNTSSPGVDVLTMGTVVRRMLLGLEPPPILIVAISSRDLNTDAPRQIHTWERFRASSAYDFIRRGDLDAVLEHLRAGTRIRAVTAALRRPELVTPPFEEWSPDQSGYEAPGWLYRQLFRSRCDQVRDVDWTTFEGATSEERERFSQRVLQPFDLDRGFEALEAVVRRSLRAGTKVILVNLPVPDDYRLAHPGGTTTFDAYRSRLATFAKDHGLTLLDAAEMFAGQDAMFRDLNHLNVVGARRLSRAVGDALEQDHAPGVVVPSR